jgi:hypothetical protein
LRRKPAACEKVSLTSPEKTRPEFPQTLGDFKHAAGVFAAEQRDLKTRPLVADYGCYPYESMTSLPVMSELLAPVYSDVSAAISHSPVVDIGCGDGDPRCVSRDSVAMWMRSITRKPTSTNSA